MVPQTSGSAAIRLVGCGWTASRRAFEGFVSGGVFAEGPFDVSLDVGPGWGVYPVAGHGCSLGPEEVLVPHDAADRGVDFWMVVNEVGEVQLFAVGSLVGAGAAELDMAGTQPGASVEIVAGKPPFGSVLGSWAALGDQPHPSVKVADQAGDGLDGAGHLGSRQHRALVPGEKGGVTASGVRGAVDDDSADIDPETWFARRDVRCHIARVLPLTWHGNY